MCESKCNKCCGNCKKLNKYVVITLDADTSEIQHAATVEAETPHHAKYLMFKSIHERFGSFYPEKWDDIDYDPETDYEALAMGTFHQNSEKNTYICLTHCNSTNGINEYTIDKWLNGR